MFYKDKRVLVAGGTGLIGATVIEELLKRGARVKATVHKKPPVVQNKAVDYVKCDLTKKKGCADAIKDVDYVVLCAANTSGAAVMTKNPMVHITTNLLINSQMLEAACLAKVDRFLFVSSTTVYPPVQYPVKEEEAFNGDPHDSYYGVGWMKRYTEILARFYHKKYGMKVAIIRPTNVYGPYDKFDFETSHVLPALIRRALEGQDPFEVWGDGSAVRDFVYSTDMADALLTALEKSVDCNPINVGSGQPVTIKESVELILKLTGRGKTRVVYDASKPTTIPIRLVDLTKAKSILGFEAKVPFEVGLKKTIDWYRKTVGI